MKDDLFLQYEEEFHGRDRKISRKERKQAIKQDRSQHKKTDKDQLEKKQITPEALSDTALRGRVLSIHPEGVLVNHEEVTYRCQLKGSLKKENTTSKNLVAVGDFVYFEPREKINGLIIRVEPRHSILSRADNLLRRKEQLIAVNIDQVIITASAVFPPLKPFLLDRYIIAAQKGNMKPILVINKVDLLAEDHPDFYLLAELKKIYEDLDIPLIAVSAHTKEGIDTLKQMMKDKASVFSGQSGTGKSSLINAVLGSNLKTGDIVEKTLKGAHTTTTAQLLPLEEGGFCIDTPGIKSFGLWDLKDSDLEPYFAEIAKASLDCKFSGCSHLQEPECAVKKALEEELISPLRFASYLSLLDTLKEKHRHR